MNTQQVSLVKVLRTLNATTPEEILEQRALGLQITAALGAVGDLPRARDAGGEKARRELDTVARKAADLARLMLNLHSDALRAFEKVEANGNLHPLNLKATLNGFVLATMRAIDEVVDALPHRGNRPRVQPRQVARQVREVYEDLTGRKAGRVTNAYRDGQTEGPFQEFLSNIFVLLNIEASADSQIKLLLSATRGKNASKIIR